MLLPTLDEAQRLFDQRAQAAPGRWVAHSRHAAEAARALAAALSPLDPDAAYVMTLLHDIGKGLDAHGMQHLLQGHSFLADLGFTNAARVCITHAFPVPDLICYTGRRNCPPAQQQFIADLIAQVTYDDYDRLVQLCDAFTLPGGCCLMEKRLLATACRKNRVSPLVIEKWRCLFTIQADFETRLNRSIYALVPETVPNTFPHLGLDQSSS